MIKATAAVGGNKDNSAINGDDVIIWDNRVSLNFENLLKRWEIPISELKSFSICPNGEFSGRIITREDGILPVYKGRKLNFPDDPLGAYRQYGEGGLVLLPYNLRKIVADVLLCLNEVALMDLNSDGPKEMDPISKFLSEGEKSPLLKNFGSTQAWAEQIFEMEKHSALSELKLIALHEDPLAFARFKKMTPLQLMREQMAEQDVLVRRVRRLSGFKTVAVNRFRHPKSRLNLLIDNLNSYHVKTSDGHVIHGYGSSNFAEVMDRLRISKDDLSIFKGHDPYDRRDKETRLARIQVFRRLARNVSKMHSQLTNMQNSVGTYRIPKGSIVDRFIDWFF
jgi:hypothetical protein